MLPITNTVISTSSCVEIVSHHRYLFYKLTLQSTLQQYCRPVSIWSRLCRHPFDDTAPTLSNIFPKIASKACLCISKINTDLLIKDKQPLAKNMHFYLALEHAWWREQQCLLNSWGKSRAQEVSIIASHTKVSVPCSLQMHVQTRVLLHFHGHTIQ